MPPCALSRAARNMLVETAFPLLIVLLCALSVTANDYTLTVGADNGVTTKYEITVFSCELDTTCHGAISRGSTSHTSKVVSGNMPGNIKYISFRLTNDNDPAANGKDVNLLIKSVIIEDYEIFPSALVDDGIITTQCIRKRDGSIVPNCPRTRGDSYIIPWNNVIYKFDGIYKLSQHVDDRHRHLGFQNWGLNDRRCRTFGGQVSEYCRNKMEIMMLDPALYEYPSSGDGAGLDHGDYTFDQTRGDMDWRGKNVDWEKAMKYAMEQSGIPSTDYTPNQVCMDNQLHEHVVDWVGPNKESVNMDIPEMNNVGGSGPLAPHVGVSYTKKVPGQTKKSVTSHFFIDEVPFTRVKLDLTRDMGEKPVYLEFEECILDYDPYPEHMLSRRRHRLAEVVA